MTKSDHALSKRPAHATCSCSHAHRSITYVPKCEPKHHTCTEIVNLSITSVLLLSDEASHLQTAAYPGFLAEQCVVVCLDTDLEV